MPVAPEKSVDTEVAEALDCRGHLALKGLPAHLAVGHDREPCCLLHRDRVIDSTILNFFEARSIDLAIR